MKCVCALLISCTHVLFFDFIKLEFKDETLKLLSCLPQRSVHTHTCRLMSGLYSQVVKIKCVKYLPY